MERSTPRNIFDERAATSYGLCAVLLWSTVATGFKLGLAQLSELQLLLVGTCFSWLVFLVAFLCTRRPWSEIWSVSAVELRFAFLLGLLNPILYYWILFAAYDRLPAHIAQPLNYTWAITLAILAVPILKQRLTAKTIGGILLSYAGVILLLNPWSAHHAGLDTSGIVLALVSTIVWALYWLLNTRVNSEPVKMMLLSFSFALPLMAGLCWLYSDWPQLNSHTIYYGAWVGLVEMGVTFLLWQQALRRTRQAGRIAQLIFLSPFLSMILIFFVLGETIPWHAPAGLTVIVAGLLVARLKS